MTDIFDTHAHYDDKAFDEDREALLESLPSQGVARVVNIGASLASCRRTVELTEAYDYIYGAIGVHPSETGELDEEGFGQLREMCGAEKCVAIGEIGLDYYWKEPEREIQKKWFLRQLHLAKKTGLPVVIHSRDAARDTVDILEAEKGGETGGVIHCYSYTKETARRFLDMGFFFGIGGVLTFQNARKLREAVEYIPLDRIVLETDSPIWLLFPIGEAQQLPASSLCDPGAGPGEGHQRGGGAQGGLGEFAEAVPDGGVTDFR